MSRIPSAAFVRPADQIEGTAAAQLFSGDVVFVGATCGIVTSQSPIAVGERFRAQTTGVYDIKANSANTFAVDAQVFWDAANREATSTSAGNTLMGTAQVAKTAGQTTVRVKLNNSNAG